MQTIFPFEKNRYFQNKRMRSADFTRELRYMDHKFQCLNRWTFGAGIAFGLQPRKMEKETEALMISQGMAVDRQGRYLIVEEPAVCRIRTLKGFGDLTGETALLWVRYRERLREPVLVSREEGEREEFAVSTEGVEFHLTPMRAEPLDTVDRVLYFDRELYADESIRVRQIMPALLSSRQPVKIRLVLENLTREKLEVKLDYAPQLPGFRMEGGKEIRMKRDLKLLPGKQVEELVLFPETSAQSVCFTLTQEQFRLQLLDREAPLARPIREVLGVVPGDPVEALGSQVLTMTPQELWGEDEDDLGIPLAALRLIRYEDEALLDEVIPLYRQQSASLPALEERLEQCRAFFPTVQQSLAHPDCSKTDTPETPAADWDSYMATGVASLNAGLHLRKGKVLCTGEICHGLGPGTVYMDFGIEKVRPAADENKNIRTIILGDSSLFIPSEDDYEHKFDRAVCIHPEKGSFELALRLKEELHESTLQLRWYAWRPEKLVTDSPEKGTLLRLEPNVIYAEPGQEIYFTPVFHGPGCSCRFFVEQPQSGLITRDGVYTAPEQEGLYQVCAQEQEDPGTKVSAFVIVRNREEGAEDERGEI